MAKTTINNGDTGLLVRTAINDNFTEVYQTDSQVRALSGNWQNTSTAYQSASASFATLSASTATQANLAIVNSHEGQTNSALVLTPKGTGAFILGPKPDGTVTGGNVRGLNAVDLQYASRSAATQVASGNYSLVSGYRSSATKDGSVALGMGNFATGDYSFSTGINSGSSQLAAASFGNGCFAQGWQSFVAGVSNTVTASNTGILCGVEGLADRLSMQSHASGRFSAKGDAQRARFVLRNKTTTNSAVELFLDGSSTRLTIPSGKIIALTINIAGVSSTGGAVAHFMRQYCLKNVAGTTTEVYAPVAIGTDNAAGTSIAISASDASDALIVSVTGTASTIWRWVASVDAVEIAYGV